MFICKFEGTRDTIISDFVKQKLFGKQILELGCSSGDRTKLFYDVGQVTAVDIVNKISSQRKKRFNLFLADATALPFQDESFDGVLSFDVVEHILDDQHFVSEAFRVCKKGGLVVFGTPNRLRLANTLMRIIGKPISYPYYLGPDVIHLREYSFEQFDSLCKSNGFVGNCMSIWVGLVGKIDRGLAIFPPSVAFLAQYLLFIGYKPRKYSV